MGEKKEVRIMWKTLPIDIFKRGVVLFIGPAEELIDFYKKEFPSDAETVEKVVKEDILETGLALGYTLKCCSDAIIWMPEPREIGVLVHEFLHAVMWILELVEVKATKETEEVMAYMLEYLYDNLVPWYQEVINKGKCE